MGTQSSRKCFRKVSAARAVPNKASSTSPGKPPAGTMVRGARRKAAAWRLLAAELLQLLGAARGCAPALDGVDCERLEQGQALIHAPTPAPAPRPAVSATAAPLLSGFCPRAAGDSCISIGGPKNDLSSERPRIESAAENRPLAENRPHLIMTVNSHTVLPRICMKYQNILIFC